MKNFLIAGALLLTLAFAPGAANSEVKIQWFGQSCFLISSPGGLKILTDPFNPELGYPMPELAPDAVLISHEHFDHNYIQMAKGNPRIFHGLDKTGGWSKVDATVKDVRIYSVNAYHFDNPKDAQRGKNAIFVMEMPAMRLAHLGDVGRALTEDQIKQIGKIDVLFIPVGGTYTVDAKAADAIIGRLNPRIIFPMHYKTAAISLPLATVDQFLAGKKNVKKIAGNIYVISKLPKDQEIIVMDYK